MSPVASNTGFRPILRLASFRYLWLSQLLALTAQNGIHFVQLVVIEQLTGRSVHIGLMVVAFSLPPVLLALVSGSIIDRVPKKWVISLSNLSRALLAFAYLPALKYMDGEALLVTIYLITFVASAIGVFNNPAVMAKVPLIVGEDRLIVANSLFNITIAGSQIVGLILLAPLAVKIGGVGGAFLLMGGCYLLALVMDMHLPRDKVRQSAGHDSGLTWQRARQDLREGWRFSIDNRLIAIAMVQLTLVTTLIMIMAMIAPGLSARVLGLAPEDAVVVFAPAGLGMFLAMIFLGRWGTKMGQQWLQTGMLLLAAAGFAMLGFVSRDYSAMRIPIFDVYPERLVSLTAMVALIVLVVGFAVYGVITIAQTSIQKLTPAPLRGRVFTVQFMVTNLVGMVPLLAAASVADWLGIPETLRWLAILCAAVAVATTAANRHVPAMKEAIVVGSDPGHPTSD